MLNMRLARPRLVVDLNGVPGLDAIIATPDGGLRVGALARHTDVATAPLVRERAPLLAEAARHIGHVAIRNRGTLGGSLAHADPAAELPAAVVALDATVVVVGPGGRRTVRAADFFRGLLMTALAPDEVLTEVHVPPQRGGWAFAEVARRPGDFALVGVAAAGIAVHDDRGAAAGGADRRDARIVGFGVADGPARLRAAEAVLAGAPLDPETIRGASLAAGQDCAPSDDVHASADYRRHLAAVLVEQVLLDAINRQTAGR